MGILPTVEAAGAQTELISLQRPGTSWVEVDLGTVIAATAFVARPGAGPPAQDDVFDLHAKDLGKLTPTTWLAPRCPTRLSVCTT
jgi:hypothetical protein